MLFSASTFLKLSPVCDGPAEITDKPGELVAELGWKLGVSVAKPPRRERPHLKLIGSGRLEGAFHLADVPRRLPELVSAAIGLSRGTFGPKLPRLLNSPESETQSRLALLAKAFPRAAMPS